jgi:hypothetical protein
MLRGCFEKAKQFADKGLVAICGTTRDQIRHGKDRVVGYGWGAGLHLVAAVATPPAVWDRKVSGPNVLLPPGTNLRFTTELSISVLLNHF